MYNSLNVFKLVFKNTLQFFKCILLIMLLQLSHFFPFIPLCPALPLPPAFYSLSSCPWVLHINSLAYPFPILFLTSPLYFVPTIYAAYSLYLSPQLPPPPPHWEASMWSPFLWFCSCSSCLFLGSVVDSCLLSFYCS